jgi:hypothetical protein
LHAEKIARILFSDAGKIFWAIKIATINKMKHFQKENWQIGLFYQ